MATPADPPAAAAVRGPVLSQIRLRPLQPAEELPAHPLLPTSTTTSPPALDNFLAAVLAEGNKDSNLPLYERPQTKYSPPAKAQIKVEQREYRPSDIPLDRREQYPREWWFARTSRHTNAAEDGTASWEEFDAGLRVNHSQNEHEYTPDLVDAHEVLSYREQLQEFGQTVGEWSEITCNVMEMVHKIPFPLAKRVFSVLVITAKATGKFLVVQIPVNLSGIKESKYRNDSKVVHGIYCSVERGTLSEDNSETEWIMATASDAKGILPMVIQKTAMPGAVAKDVGLFIDWTMKRRKAKA